MGFIARAFTPPGSGAFVPPTIPTPPPIPAPPPVPTPTAAPPAPPQLSPEATPAARQRAAITGTTFLGAGAAAGQTTGKKSLLGQ